MPTDALEEKAFLPRSELPQMTLSGSPSFLVSALGFEYPTALILSQKLPQLESLRETGRVISMLKGWFGEKKTALAIWWGFTDFPC